MPRLQLDLNLPNQLTLFRIALTPVFAWFLLSDSSLFRQLSLVIFVIAAFTDWYDGWIARKMGYTTRWGKFLDPLADKILSSTALLVYVSLGLVDAWMVWIIIARDFLITGLRTYMEYHDQPIVTSKSAQAKTFGEFVVIYYILILYVARSVPSVYEQFGSTIDSLMHPQVLFGMMLLVTLSSVGTGIAYLVDNWKNILELSERFRTRRPE
ncbi:MAG TPA: CDP-diacylglycerol--glycerol-3-phosphate 3-phosphatidyltransferase [Bacteroidota bacterium]|nr:CDP-diacylglycerol--glycerol-3-phosphate 3-phosphatidyltransferase [Bacteroidota bacterium]